MRSYSNAMLCSVVLVSMYLGLASTEPWVEFFLVGTYHRFNKFCKNISKKKDRAPIQSEHFLIIRFHDENNTSTDTDTAAKHLFVLSFLKKISEINYAL